MLYLPWILELWMRFLPQETLTEKPSSGETYFMWTQPVTKKHFQIDKTEKQTKKSYTSFVNPDFFYFSMLKVKLRQDWCSNIEHGKFRNFKNGVV